MWTSMFKCNYRENKLAQFVATPDYERSMETGYMLYHGGRGGMRVESLP